MHAAPRSCSPSPHDMAHIYEYTHILYMIYIINIYSCHIYMYTLIYARCIVACWYVPKHFSISTCIHLYTYIRASIHSCFAWVPPTLSSGRQYRSQPRDATWEKQRGIEWSVGGWRHIPSPSFPMIVWWCKTELAGHAGHVGFNTPMEMPCTKPKSAKGVRKT